MKIFLNKKVVISTVLTLSLLLSGCGSSSAQKIAAEQNGGKTPVSQRQSNQQSNSHRSFFAGTFNKTATIKAPNDKFVLPTITPSVKAQLTSGKGKLSYDNGVVTILNGPSLNVNVSSAPYVQLPKPNPAHGNRLEGSARAWLNHSSRQYRNRQQTGNGRGSYKPVGFIQRMNLNPAMSGYNHLYDRGHLIAYAIAGNVRGFDPSESNANNIVTQTAWANETGASKDGGTTNGGGQGQNYYEGIIRQKLDQNDQIMYQVTPIYDSDRDIIPRGIHLQAANKYGQLFDVYIPNAQNGVEINYHTGKSKVVGTN